MSLFLCRLHSWLYDPVELAARSFCEFLKLEQLPVAFLVESDHGRATIVLIDEWALTWLGGSGDEGRVVEFAPHFDLRLYRSDGAPWYGD